MAEGSFASYLANNYVNDKGEFQVAQLGSNSNGQQTQPSPPTREFGPIKWQANPYPDWVRKFHGKMGAVLGGTGGGLLGGIIEGGTVGSAFEPGVGTLIGGALGGIAGSYADDALDYIGVPSNVQVTLPDLPDAPQVQPTDTSNPGSGLDTRPTTQSSYSSR